MNPKQFRPTFSLISVVATIFLLLPAIPALADLSLAFQPQDSLEEIRAKIEQNGYSFSVSNNHIFSMPLEERQRLRSRRPSDPTMDKKAPLDPGPLMNHLGAPLPTSFDWRDRDGKSYIGPVRNQGSCGACYAFGAAASAEGVYNKAMDLYDANAADFSEAYIAFCLDDEYSAHFGGCGGADYDYQELQALVDFGVPDETVYPYVDQDQDCPLTSEPPLVQFKSWHRVLCQDVDAIKTAIMKYGVVDAAVMVTSAFDAYDSGVYEDQNNSCNADPCYNATTNHAIALVGWDDNPPEGGGGCWILRNSWGENWGEGGYMRIRYDSAAVSCAVSYLVYEEYGPKVSIGTATGVNDTTATLNGSVNPNGFESDYYFEYGQTEEFGSTTPQRHVITGTTALAVSEAISGLTPQTTYHFRLAATNADGSVTSKNGSFTTSGDPTAPSATTGDASVELNIADLFGVINPHGSPTTWYFEYGQDDSYGSMIESEDTITGTAITNVFLPVGDLDWDATYHYRLVAENAVTITYGLDRTFTTIPRPNLPLIENTPPQAVGSVGAVLTGKIDQNNVEDAWAYYYIEYGLTDEYGKSTLERELYYWDKELKIWEALYGLEPNTMYHYRIVAGNVVSETLGEDQVFTTTQTLYHESFNHDGYEPDDWFQENMIEQTDWVFSNGNLDYSEGFTALLCSDNIDDMTILATPPLNLEGAVSPTLSFYYSGDVYPLFKTSESDEWQYIEDYTGEYIDDLEEGAIPVLNLPQPSSTYYIGFEAMPPGKGECAVLDRVTISARSWVAGTPMVTTGVVTNTTYISTTVEGEVLSAGDSSVTSRGLCWNTSPMPTVSHDSVQVAGDTGPFSGILTGLIANTRYHVRAFATNAQGTSYGESLEFITKELPGPRVAEATDVFANQFTANWEALEGATGYYIDVWTSPTPMTTAKDSSTRKAGNFELTATGNNTIQADFSFEGQDLAVTQNQTYTYVALEDGLFPDQAPGYPGLPARYVNILLPDGATVADLQVSGKEALVEEDALVYPTQLASSPSLPVPDFTPPDPVIYASLDFYPNELATVEDVQSMGGSTYVSLRLNPVRYVPGRGEVYFAREVSVSLTLGGGRKAASSGSAFMRQAVNSMVINPSEKETARKALTAPDSIDYLIITTQALTPAFESLLSHRTSFSGMSGEIVTIEDIEANYSGLDTPEKIRNCIKGYVDQQNTAFVVLGGDDTIVEPRMCPIQYAMYNEKTPTDLYYSALDGNWDANDNQIYGELDDEVDMAPDVLVGRIPIRTEGEANAYIDKLITYETNPPENPMSRLLLAGTVLRYTYNEDDRPTDIIGDGYPEFQDANHTSVSDSEMWSRRMYRDNIKPYWEPENLSLAFDTLTTWDAADAGDYELSPGALKAALDQGWDHFFFNGHGNYPVWALENGERFYSDDALTIEGTTPFLYTTACMSNGFDNADHDPCLSEAFIRSPDGGSLTYIGCSRYGWGSSDHPPAGTKKSRAGSDHYAEFFYKRALEPDFVSAGEAFALHKADMAPLSISTGISRWLQFGINLMGDPAIMTGKKAVPGYYRLYVGDVTSFTLTGLDSNTTYSYQVRAEDGVNPLSVSQPESATTADMDISISNDSVDENLPSGTTVGDFSTSDPGQHTFALVPGEGDEGNGSFSIDGSTLKTASVFDHETKGSYSIRVQTNDGAGVLEEVFTIIVNDIGEADIALTKTVDDSMPPVGGQVIYTLTATNLGPDDGSGIQIMDALPGELTYVSDTSQGAYNSATGLWDLGALALDATSAISITATVAQSGTITNTVVLSSTTSVEYNPDNDTARAVIATDTDLDGLSDDLENATCTDPNDRDSDDDGLLDGEEDANLNGAVDQGETQPCNPDSDNDGVWDGTEAGLTANDVGQDTDLAVFKPDADPSTTTNPLNPDSDDDGWMDGEEDINANGKVDEGEANPLNPATPVATPPVVVQTIPHDGAGIDDDLRIPTNTCFAVFLEDEDGLDITAPEAVVFTINDGTKAQYERNLGDDSVVDVIKLTDDPDTKVTKLWAVYNRAAEILLDPVYPYGATVTVAVDAKDMRKDSIDQATFDFKVETQQQQEDAAASQPEAEPVDPNDPALGGDYDAGVQATENGMGGAKIVYDSTGPVAPYFGSGDEVPALGGGEIEAVGVPLNLQPPAVFTTPAKVFIPCPGQGNLGDLSVYLYDGTQWVLACDGAGNVAPGGEGWMVPGSRVNHPETNPPTIEIQVYHFTGVQAAAREEEAQPPPDSDSGNCFVGALK